MSLKTEPDQETVELSDETSRRVCDHMNIDHAVSVFAMAKRLVGTLEPGFKISEAQLKKVTRLGCDIQAVTCRQDMCQVHRVVWPFEPPLRTSAELRQRLVAIHHKVCAPRLRWLIEKPVAIAIIALMLFLNVCVLILGTSELRLVIESDAMLNQIVSVLFGSAKVFALLVKVAFYFAHSAHAAEAIYAAFHCFRTLKLQWKPTFQWIAPILFTGYPFLLELQTLIDVAQRKRRIN